MKQVDDIRTYVWIEFTIWFMILCLIIGGVRIYRYHKYKELSTYQIFIPDVDGLIVGSPVRYMGVQIGYIDKIKIVTNNVYVKFIITDKNLNLPRGSIATVEFYGLGGSKSLEIYPPTEQSIATNKLVDVHNPMRLHDSLGLLNDMFDKLGSITGRISYFAKKSGIEDSISGSGEIVNLDSIEKNIVILDNWVDNYTEKRNKRINKKNMKKE